VFSPNPAALALGATGGSGCGSGAGSLLSTLSSSIKEGRDASGGGGSAGGAAPGGGGAGTLAQHQQLVAALHGRVARVTAEVEDMRKRVEKERAR
jgi:hypothetical protein